VADVAILSLAISHSTMGLGEKSLRLNVSRAQTKALLQFAGRVGYSAQCQLSFSKPK